jgi:hypothetical protein
MNDGRSGELRNELVGMKLIVNGCARRLAVEPRTTPLDHVGSCCDRRGESGLAQRRHA